MTNLAKESEILFIWDTRLSNPNGDMMSDNANRFDEIDEKAIVSDVRIKRTVRDYIQYHKNIDIFVNNDAILAGYVDNSTLKSVTAENRFNQIKEQFEDLEDEKDIFLSCIDNRLFGGVAPKSGLQLIGAVQFSWTKSLNKTETVLSQGTGAFATESKKDGEAKFTKTFRVDNYIPYAIFPTYGTINRANVTNCQTTQKDIDELIEGLWFGTKKLNTHTKMGQKPRLLLEVIYKDDSNYFVGLLDELVTIKNSEEIRSLDEAEFDFSELIKALNSAKNFIDKVKVILDTKMSKYKSQLEKINKIEFIEETKLLIKE
jgi:CRISPR-associated protein Csh2